MRTKALLTCALALALAVAAPAVAGNGGFAPLDPVSDDAENIRTLWWVIGALLLGIFLLVEGLLVLFLVRYRRRRRARFADGAQIHGSTRLELLWTFSPLLVLVVIAAFVFVKLDAITSEPEATAAASPGEAVGIEVQGRQFYWEFLYDGGAIAVDRLRIPVDTPIRLTITAPEWDVIHSWWIPSLGGKTDAIPGTVNRTSFVAERTGTFSGQCAELCGLLHARMLATVEVMEQDAFRRWLSERAGTADAQGLGAETWAGACAKCHGFDGQGGLAVAAPTLTGNPAATDREALERVVRNGRNEMPPVGRGWPDAQMDALASYVEGRFGSGG